MRWTETAQAWAAIGGGTVSLIGLVAVVVQLRHLVENLRSSARRATYDIGIRLKDVFIEYPHLRPYFFDNLRAPADHPESGRIASIAELYCIYMQEIATQSGNVSSANRTSWLSLLKSIHSSSPAVRAQLEDHFDWYSEELREAVRLVESATVVTPRPESVPAPGAQ
ncbi:hypothetical protein [Streptomyces sp. NPDC000880]